MVVLDEFGFLDVRLVGVDLRPVELSLVKVYRLGGEISVVSLDEGMELL